MERTIAPRPGPGRSALPAALLAAAVVFAACLAWLPHLERRLDPLTGDEPFYVMTSISLIDDHDLDERNNYDRRDYDRFYPAFGPTRHGWSAYPDPLPPHQSLTKRSGLYSKHGLGLALLIAVPFDVGGRTLTIVLLAAIAATVAANISLLAARYTRSPTLALAVTISLALTNPLFSFSLLIFPEMIAGLGITYATRRLLELENRTWQWFLIGVSAASLPWLHYRLAPISVVLAIVALIRFKRVFTIESAVAAAAAPVVSAATLFWWYERLYNRPLPPAADHAGFSGFAGSLNGLAGTLLDQQWGAFIHNPILFLATAAFVPFLRARRADALLLAAVVIPYLILISCYRVWWGEWNPPARYLTDVAPLFAAPLTWWLGAVAKTVRWTSLFLFAVPAVAVIATFVADPQRMYNHPDGSSRLLETWRSWTSVDLTGVVPSYVFYSASPADFRVTYALFGVAALGTIATAAGYLISTSNAKPSAVSHPIR